MENMLKVHNGSFSEGLWPHDHMDSNQLYCLEGGRGNRYPLMKWHISSWLFLTFLSDFWIPIIFSNFNSNCSNLLDMRNLQEQVKKAFCYQKLFWPFTVWINCSTDLKNFVNSQPSASYFKSFSRSLEQLFFLTVGQNNFGNKIPFLRNTQFTSKQNG